MDTKQAECLPSAIQGSVSSGGSSSDKFKKSETFVQHRSESGRNQGIYNSSVDAEGQRLTQLEFSSPAEGRDIVVKTPPKSSDLDSLSKYLR